MKKALYSAIIVAFMCSGLAYAEKVSMKEYLTELKTSEYTEVQETKESKCRDGELFGGIGGRRKSHSP